MYYSVVEDIYHLECEDVHDRRHLNHYTLASDKDHNCSFERSSIRLQVLPLQSSADGIESIFRFTMKKGSVYMVVGMHFCEQTSFAERIIRLLSPTCVLQRALRCCKDKCAFGQIA